jgi:protein-tyrosine phosphatase
VTDYRLTFVCLGNICRSPMAEAVMAHRVAEQGWSSVLVDSAGTGDWHLGEDADRRARTVLEARGYPLSHSARQFERSWFADRDLVVALDQDNLGDLRRLAPDKQARSRIALLREFDPNAGELDVPDPYYGDSRGFHQVLDIIEAACAGLLDHVGQQLRVAT